MRLTSGIRLFYDVPSSPRRVEAALLVCDVLMVAAPLFYVTAVLHRTAPLAEGLSLFCWAAIPRCVSRFVGWLGRPKDTLKVYLLSATFLVLTVALMIAGWEIVYASATPRTPIGIGTGLLAVASWGSGFLLFQPRTYRLFDFLCGAVLLLGLFEQKPEPWLWVPVFFCAFLASASARHLLRDIQDAAPARHLNFQNLRALAAAGTLATAGIFLALGLAFVGDLDFPEMRHDAGSSRTSSRRATRLVAFPEPQEAEERDRKNEFFRSSLSLTQEQDPGDPASYRGSLTGLARRPTNSRVDVVIRAPGIVRGSGGPSPELVVDAPRAELDPRLRWPPPPELASRMLYRAITFTVFEPGTHTWAERPALVKRPWPRGPELAVEPDRRLTGDDALFVEISFPRKPVFRSLLAPYWTQRYRALLFESWSTNRAGDVFPDPAPREHDSYHCLVQPLPGNVLPGNGALPGRYPDDPATLEVPELSQLGIDLRRLAARVFRSDEHPVAALRRYFVEGGFTYSRFVFWPDHGEVLRDFLRTERTGNCSFYATAAALLLRARGVSTRLAAGYLAGEWVEDRRELHLKHSMVHGWVEVYFPDRGWFPVDPIAWVPVDESSDAGPEEDAIADGSSGPERSDAGGGLFGAGTSHSVYHGDDGSRRGSDGRRAAPAPVHTPDRSGVVSTAAGEEEDFAEWIDFAPDVGSEGGPGRLDDDRRAGLRYGDSPIRRLVDGGDAALEEYDELAGISGTLRRFQTALRWSLVGIAIAALLLAVHSFRKARPDDPEIEDAPDDEPGDSPLDDLEAATSMLDLDRSDPRGAIIASYHELQHDLRLTRSHRRPAQTPREHGRELSGRRSAPIAALDTIVDLLYRSLYGDADINREEAHEFERSCRQVRRFFA